jgi:hypothetical protein
MKRTLLWLITLIGLVVLAAVYFWPEEQRLSQKPSATEAPAAKPPIRHPIESVAAPENPLPPLRESDGPLSEALMAMLGNLPDLVYSKNIIHRIVATVDNLPRDYVAPAVMPAKPVPKLPIITMRNDELILSPKNSERYAAYVRLAEAIPTDSAVSLYARFYPLFQEQYEELGYPGRYFNDRVIEVIDHLLATPAIDGPLVLVQPRVLYEFADPKLESLSAGQKILLRMGRTNQLKLKAKLKEIRQAIVSLPPGNAARSHDPQS